MERDFRDIMPHSVTVNALASKGADGAPVYSTSGSTYRARVKNIHRQVRDGRGNVVMAAFEVWLASTSILSAQSKYTLPSGQTPPVLSLAVIPDEDGHHHCKLLFGA